MNDAVTAPHQVNEAQIEPRQIAQQQRIAEVLGRVHDDGRTRYLPHGLVQPARELVVGVEGAGQPAGRARAGDPGDIAVPVNGRTQADDLVNVQLVPSAEPGLADAGPEGAVPEPGPAPAAVIPLQAPAPDELKLADREESRDAGEHPVEQGAAASPGTTDIDQGRTRHGVRPGHLATGITSLSCERLRLARPSAWP